jgi:hypothetical protein
MNAYPTTDKDIAQFWGVAIRTLFRWKGDNAPIHSLDEMCRWLSTRKNLPRSVLEKIRLPDQESVSSPVSVGSPGAAAALKRLETTELQAFERLQAALARGNPLEMCECRESWLKVSESLRKFDLMVEASRRDAGELVPVSEVSRFIRSFLAFAAVSFTAQAESCTNEIAGKPELEVYSQIRQICSRSLFVAALGYIKGGGGNNPDPRLVAYAQKCVDEQFAHFPAQAKGDLEQNLLALIRWAKEQP